VSRVGATQGGVPVCVPAMALRAIMRRRMSASVKSFFSLPQKAGLVLPEDARNITIPIVVPRTPCGVTIGHCRPSTTQVPSPPSTAVKHKDWTQETRATVALTSMDGEMVSLPFLRMSYMSLMVDSKIALDTVRKMVHLAAEVNTRNGLTGRLSYDAQSSQVWQILEGDPQHVLAVWERIRHDPRHTIDEDTVTFDRTAWREYPIWAMKLRVMMGDMV